MAKPPKDPTEAMRERAASYPGVDQGTACTQSSFKAGKKSFFFVGMQGGRHKAMFKLEGSLPQAEALAAAHPDDYQVGNTAWVTARFSAEAPMPAARWKAWLDESYALSAPKGGARSKPAKKTKPRAKA